MFGCFRINGWTPISGDNATAANQAIESLLRQIHDVAQTSAPGFKGLYKKECSDLSRRVALLSHFVEELRDLEPLTMAYDTSSFRSSISQLTAALKAAKMLLQSAGSFDHIVPSEIETLKFTNVTYKLEKALANFPYGDFEISEDIKQQVNLVRYQLKRARKGEGVKISTVLKSSDSDKVPFDFLCPISLDLMKDPVIVSTGQTYERSYIERWIKSGRRTCPKSCQRLKNKDLIPNHVLKNMIAEWCKDHDDEQPTLPKNESILGNSSSQYFQDFMIFLTCMPFVYFIRVLYYFFA